VITKELDKVGIPTAHICTMTPVAKTVGSNRIISGAGIIHPVGNPEIEYQSEKKQRRNLVLLALGILQK
jgi:glycine reductase complex component B subunit gamma